MSTYEEIFKTSTEKRNAFWNTIGTVDNDVLAALPGSSFFGGPAWPSRRQAYEVIHLEEGTILASEGMSDPYHDFDEQGNSAKYQGLGLEYYIKTKDQLTTADTDSWQLQLLRNVCQVTAGEAGLIDGFKVGNMYTISLSNPGLPEQFVDDQDFVAVMLGIMPEGELSEPADLPIEPTYMVNCLLITTAELTYTMEHGKEGREEVRRRLLEKYPGGYSVADRESVV